MEEQIKKNHPLTEAETSLLREYEAAMTQVQLQMLGLKQQQEQLEKGLDEARHNAAGTLRLIMRTHKLEGAWQPNPDFTELVRAQ